MVYLSFKLKNIEYIENSGWLKMKIRNLKITESDGEIVEKVGSFGSANTSVSDIKTILINPELTWSDNLFFIQLGFKLDPNFTFKGSVDKSPEWLCCKYVCVEENVSKKNGKDNVYEDWIEFAYYGIKFDIVDHPLSDKNIKEVKELKELLINSIDNEKKKLQPKAKISEEKLERIYQEIENSLFYQNYKRKLDNQQLPKLQEELEKAEIELAIAREKNATFQEQLTQLKTKLDFYEQFFNNHLQTRKNRLNKLKEKLSDEEKEWWDIYWEAYQENEENSFAQKQLIRAEKKLNEKLNEEELNEFLVNQKEISELEKQLENFSINEQEFQTKIEIPLKLNY